MGSFSEFKLSSEVFENIKTEKMVKEKELNQVQIGDQIKTRAFVVQSFEPRFYQANIETGKKITEEEIAAGTPSEKRAILNIVLDDGSETLRAVLFHEMVQKLGMTEYSDQNLMKQQVQNILGKEMFFGGNVRNNTYFNIPELIVDSIEEINLDELIKEIQ